MRRAQSLVLAVLGAALTAICAPAPAAALSCLRHDLARTYQEAARAEATYVVVSGILTFDPARLPRADMSAKNRMPPQTLIPARLTGMALTLDGYTSPFDQPITLNARCLGPWCAQPESGSPYLSFLEKTAAGHLLTLNPCGGFGFANPTQEILDQALQCFRGGACKPGPGY